MKLYGTLLSPFVRKVRVMLAEKDLSYEFVICNQWAPDSVIVTMNPLLKVPVLELEDGKVLFESPFIMEWLDEHHGKSLVPEGHDERWLTKSWHNVANGILDAISALNSENRRPVEKSWQPARERAQERVDRALDFVESQLKGGTFLAGNEFTVADIALGVALDQIDIRYPHDWRSTHFKLDRWHAAISQRPSFIFTAPPSEALQRVTGK